LGPDLRAAGGDPGRRAAARAMSVDVVVVTYESAAQLRDCLTALPPGTAVTVVDNASTDGSADLAESLGARVVRNAENTGFAAAANAGAREGNAELVLFL